MHLKPQERISSDIFKDYSGDNGWMQYSQFQENDMAEDQEFIMKESGTNAVYLFNRMELAGSLGDLGTILPLDIG